MKKCNTCGKQAGDNDDFCAACGGRLPENMNSPQMNVEAGAVAAPVAVQSFAAVTTTERNESVSFLAGQNCTQSERTTTGQNCTQSERTARQNVLTALIPVCLVGVAAIVRFGFDLRMDYGIVFAAVALAILYVVFSHRGNAIGCKVVWLICACLLGVGAFIEPLFIMQIPIAQIYADKMQLVLRLVTGIVAGLAILACSLSFKWKTSDALRKIYRFILFLATFVCLGTTLFTHLPQSIFGLIESLSFDFSLSPQIYVFVLFTVLLVSQLGAESNAVVTTKYVAYTFAISFLAADFLFWAINPAMRVIGNWMIQALAIGETGFDLYVEILMPMIPVALMFYVSQCAVSGLRRKDGPSPVLHVFLIVFSVLMGVLAIIGMAILAQNGIRFLFTAKNILGTVVVGAMLVLSIVFSVRYLIYHRTVRADQEVFKPNS